MARNYGEIAFTTAVKEMQEKLGSRKSYARLERESYVDGLTENETAFILERDSFYLATVSENEFPYLQHRGGPRGFLTVLDPHRIGFVDFRGNLQYVSVGNLATNDRVSLILVDYPARARLKIFARAKIVEVSEDLALYERLRPENYKFRPERMIIFTIEAYDWNCSQHITPRYSLPEIEELLAVQRQQIRTLEDQVSELQAKCKQDCTKD